MVEEMVSVFYGDFANVECERRRAFCHPVIRLIEVSRSPYRQTSIAGPNFSLTNDFRSHYDFFSVDRPGENGKPSREERKEKKER